MIMYKEKIDAYIDSKKDEMLADLASLVRIDSQKREPAEGKPFGEGPAQALALAQTMMEKYGLSVKNYDNYVVAGDLSDAPKQLDILAHLDVVPVTQDWTVTQPFEMKIVGDRVYGRGTADDKGPAVAALYALRAVKELNIPLSKSVRLILGSDEECGSSDLKHYFSIEQEAPYTFTPDADFPLINIEKGFLRGSFTADFKDGLQLPGVVSFKSGDKINVVPQRASFVVAGLDEAVIGQAAEQVTQETGVTFTICRKEDCGSEAYEVAARGMAAHASTPQEGKNALTASLRLIAKLPLADSEGLRALRALDTLLPYEDTCGKALGIFREDEASGAVTVCFSLIDYTPEHLSGAFDSRLPLGCDAENTQEPAVKRFAEYSLTLDAPIGKPHCVPGDSDFVKTLLSSYERYTGVKGEALSTGGGTYVHNLERGVAFGCGMPGVDNHMHGDDEFMEIGTLVMSAKIFADAIVKLCS